MKKTIMYSFAICLLLTCSWACNNDKKVAQDLKSTTISETIELCGLDGNPQKKQASDAVIELNRYNNYYNSLMDSLPATASEHLTLGIEVTHIQELFEVVCAIKDDPTSTLYIMNAIKDVQQDGKMVPETDMIFVVVSTNSKSVSEPQPNHYFDFTSPCPAACPNIAGVNYPVSAFN